MGGQGGEGQLTETALRQKRLAHIRAKLTVGIPKGKKANDESSTK